MIKFEQVSSDSHEMSLVGWEVRTEPGLGGPEVTWDPVWRDKLRDRTCIHVYMYYLSWFLGTRMRGGNVLVPPTDYKCKRFKLIPLQQVGFECLQHL